MLLSDLQSIENIWFQQVGYPTHQFVKTDKSIKVFIESIKIAKAVNIQHSILVKIRQNTKENILFLPFWVTYNLYK